MGVGEQTRGRVEACLSELQDRYGPFSVNQTTVSLPETVYERVRGAPPTEEVTLFAAVENDDGDVLYVNEDDARQLPGTTTSVEDALEGRVQQVVSERTGVKCRIDDVIRTLIRGLRNEASPDQEQLYRLVVVFSATHEAGAPKDDSYWQEPPRDPRLAGIPVR